MSIRDENARLTVALDETSIWGIDAILPTAKLYLLALARTGDEQSARRMAGIPADEISAISAWLIDKGYVRRVVAGRSQGLIAA